MAYEYERDEWRAAIRTVTRDDLDHRRVALGIIGDATDDLGTNRPDDDPDEAA